MVPLGLSINRPPTIAAGSATPDGLQARTSPVALEGEIVDPVITCDHTHRMRARLQLVLDETELRELRRAARRDRRDAERKAPAILASARHAFSTADVERMLAEIEGGYLGHRPAGS
jgi:hypothetical protein